MRVKMARALGTQGMSSLALLGTPVRLQRDW